MYIGGAKGQSGVIYLHNGNGKLSIGKSLPQDSSFEDTAAAFFDADGDNDLDLLVASGGNEVNSKNKNLIIYMFYQGETNFLWGNALTFVNYIMACLLISPSGVND